jgi:hypothetical protein
MRLVKKVLYVLICIAVAGPVGILIGSGIVLGGAKELFMFGWVWGETISDRLEAPHDGDF